MDTQCNSKTLRGSLTILFCISKQIGYHMLRAKKCLILQHFDSRVRTVLWHAVLLKRSILTLCCLADFRDVSA